jgi:hypothetical protein
MRISGRAAGTLVAVLAALSATAEAASVKDVNTKKKIIGVDLEEDETAEVGTTICFLTPAGKDIDCGDVTKVKGTMVLVKMTSAKKLKRIKPGGAARIGEAAEDDAETEAPAKGVAKNKKQPFRVWGYYSPGLATPTAYNKVGYGAPATGETPTSLWEADKKITQTYFGFALQVGIPVSHFSINPGVRYRSYNPSVVDADYVKKQENPYVSTEETANAIGFWTDFQYLRISFTPSIGLGLTGGLDFDMSTVTMKTEKKDDTGATPEAEVASATSKLTVVSLRLGATLDFMFVKVFGSSLAINLQIPLAETGRKLDYAFEEGEDRGLEDPKDDFQKQLGHGKNTAGLEIALGPVLAF